MPREIGYGGGRTHGYGPATTRALIAKISSKKRRRNATAVALLIELIPSSILVAEIAIHAPGP